MEEREKITQPSLGSNELGSETNDSHPTGISAGSDTQQQMAAKSGKKKQGQKKRKSVQESVRGAAASPDTFPELKETEE